MAMASRQDLLLGQVTLEKIVLGSPPGTSKNSSSIQNNKNVSNAARANQLAMARRLDERADDMRNKLVKRVATTNSRRDYRAKKKRKQKNALRPMTREEEERALLEPLEFVSKKSSCFNSCCGRVVFTELTGPGAAATRLFKLTDKDLCRIKKCFDAIDYDESGSITQSEFFQCLELADTPFTRQLCNSIVFEIADSDQNNSLTFDEFVLGVSVVCTLTRDQLLYFVFRCFDIDNSGALNTHEFVKMSMAINEAGGGFFDGNFLQLVDKFDKDGDGSVDFQEFLSVDSVFPMAFFPVFRMQDQLRQKTLSADKWIRLISAYDAEEKKKCESDADLHTAVREQIPFVERMVRLGAMDHIEQGGFHDLRRASLEKQKRQSLGANSSNESNSATSSALNTCRNDLSPELGPQRSGRSEDGHFPSPNDHMQPLELDCKQNGDGMSVVTGDESVNSLKSQQLAVVFEGMGDNDIFNATKAPSRGDSQGFKLSLNPTHSFRSRDTFSPTKMNARWEQDGMTSAPPPHADEDLVNKKREKKKGMLSSFRSYLTGKKEERRVSISTTGSQNGSVKNNKNRRKNRRMSAVDPDYEPYEA